MSDDVQRLVKMFLLKLQIVSVIVILSISLTYAAPLDDSRDAQIVRYESDNIGIDGYKFS